MSGVDTDLDRMTPQTCPAGIHADWAVDSEHTHDCPRSVFKQLGLDNLPDWLTREGAS